jgi:hypothetical protein
MYIEDLDPTGSSSSENIRHLADAQRNDNNELKRNFLQAVDRVLGMGQRSIYDIPNKDVKDNSGASSNDECGGWNG